jgi:DNA processing protein
MSEIELKQQFLDENDISELESSSKNYPKNLRIARKNLPNIFHLGDMFDYSNAVSVVGTRSCSDFGKEFAENLGQILSDNKFKVISGLARGIDTAAHTGCVKNEGIGIAILPWFHKLYPPENKFLLDAIIERGGCAISENLFQPKTNPRFQFLNRDELMVALSIAIVVVESKSKGGAKYTSDYAKRKGVPVIIVKTKTTEQELIEGFETFKNNGAIVAEDESEVIKILNELKTKNAVKPKNNIPSVKKKKNKTTNMSLDKF